ncbi:MAG: hypothetical protein ACK4Z5_00175 [Brevundimonas sp.]
MEFRPIQRAKPGDNQVTLHLTQRGVSVTIPGRVAGAAGLAETKNVSLAYGEDRRKRCIQVRADADGAFTLSSRGPTRQLLAKELAPKKKIEGKKAVAFETGNQGLIITLPEGWELADQGVVGG